jgi:hypothetical protein
MTVAPPRSRPRKPLNAGMFQAEIGSFRLHLAAEGKAAKTVRMYAEAVRWFAAAHLLPQTSRIRWEQAGRQDIQRWLMWLLGATATRTPATSTVPCSSSEPGPLGHGERTRTVAACGIVRRTSHTSYDDHVRWLW